MGKLVLIAPFRKLAHLAQEVSREQGISLEIRVGKLKEGVSLARQSLQDGAELIISQGATTLMLSQENLPVPLVEIVPTGYDLLRAVLEARAQGGTIGILDNQELIEGCTLLEEILGLSMVKITLQDFEHINQGIEALLRQGAKVIIGNICVYTTARERGLPAVLIPCGKEAVARALREAQAILANRYREITRLEEIRAIFRLLDNGVIAIDSSGRVTAFNQTAEKLLGIKEGEVTGKSVAGIPLGERLQNTLTTGKAALSEVERLNNGNTLLVNYIPILVDQEVRGAVATFHETSRLQQLDQKIRRSLLQKGHVAKYTFSDIEGTSQKIQTAIETARRFSQVDATVLICGETGVGKEIFAHALHNASLRREGPFIAVNCAAVPESLLESELFGYAEGAFTGAKRGGKQGLFELAHKGTIFLDEISEMSERLQTRLLRVLQEREVMRLGDDRIIPVDIRVIAATNADILRMVAEKRFRADLYYRINVLTLVIPPLRERPEDIIQLTQSFINLFNQKFNKQVRGIAPAGIKLLLDYPWPGNIRELRNTMERLVILADGEMVPASLVAECLNRTPVPAAGEQHPPGEELIWDILASVKGNRKQAAQILGISRTTLWRRLKKLQSRPHPLRDRTVN